MNKCITKEIGGYHFIKGDSYTCDNVACKINNITWIFTIYLYYVIFKKNDVIFGEEV